MHKLADAQRRGYAERARPQAAGDGAARARRRRTSRGSSRSPRRSGATALLELLSPDQRDAIRAHVIDERGYDEIARSLATSESVVRKRVSRGLAAVRRRMGAHERRLRDPARAAAAEAAERDVRRSAPVRALRGSRRFSPALAGAVALAVVVAAVVAATLWLRGDETPLPAQPRVVATLHVTDNPVQIVDAFGSIWIADHVAGRILRVDPATGAVQATIQVRTGNWLWITPVGGQLWASVDELPLIQRIDPGTNRVVARTPVRTPDGRPFRVGDLSAAGDNVWAVSGERRAAPRPRDRPRPSCSPTRRATCAGSSSATTPCGRSASATRSTASTRAPGRAGAASRPGSPARRGSRRSRAPCYATRGAELARLDRGDGRGDLDPHVPGAVERDDAVPGRRSGCTSRSTGRATGSSRSTSRRDARSARRRSTRSARPGSPRAATEIWLNTPGGATVVVRQDTR